MVTIYTSFNSACPRLVCDIRDIYQKVADPETDTPRRSKEYAVENQMDGPQWYFLQGSLEDVRVFANVLAVKYKKIDPQVFSHSSIISVFDENGVIRYQREGLGEDTAETIREIRSLTALD